MEVDLPQSGTGARSVSTRLPWEKSSIQFFQMACALGDYEMERCSGCLLVVRSPHKSRLNLPDNVKELAVVTFGILRQFAPESECLRPLVENAAM